MQVHKVSRSNYSLVSINLDGFVLILADRRNSGCVSGTAGGGSWTSGGGSAASSYWYLRISLFIYLAGWSQLIRQVIGVVITNVVAIPFSYLIHVSFYCPSIWHCDFVRYRTSRSNNSTGFPHNLSGSGYGTMCVDSLIWFERTQCNRGVVI